MTSSRAFGFVIIAGAGILGAFLGRAVPHGAPGVAADASGSPTSPGTTPAGDECEAERSALASTKAKLDSCMAINTTDPGAVPSGIPSAPEPEPPASNVEAPLQEIITEEIRSYHERLESLSEAVIVRHSNGTIRVYKPEEWAIDGDGIVVARKFENGEIGRYAGPDAGPRSDPAAFRVRRGAPARTTPRLGESVDEPASP
jgi:hypothetical protein